MSFRNRLVFFIFGILIGVFVIKMIFPSEKISKIKKGYSAYFKGHDKIVNFLLDQKYIREEIEFQLNISKNDSLFYEDFIRSSDLKIVSRKPCFQYLLKPNNKSISELLIKKCDEKVELVRLKKNGVDYFNVLNYSLEY